MRSWRERLDLLEKLGFIRTSSKGSRSRAYVLILHPHQVVRRLRDEKRVPDFWWSVFRDRIISIGGKMPVGERGMKQAAPGRKPIGTEPPPWAGAT